jgi:hypothetical protein
MRGTFDAAERDNMSNGSDLIREFVNRHYTEPGRRVGKSQVSVRAGDVHSKMLLTSKMPQVCGALGASLFDSEYRVKLLQRDGPQNGANLHFTFEIL